MNRLGIGIIGLPDYYEVRRLADEIEQLGHNPVVINPSQMAVSSDENGKYSLLDHKGQPPDPIDLVFRDGEFRVDVADIL